MLDIFLILHSFPCMHTASLTRGGCFLVSSNTKQFLIWGKRWELGGRAIDSARAKCWNDAATPCPGLIAGRMSENWGRRVLFSMQVIIWLFKPFFFHHYNFLDYQETERTLTCILQQTSWYSSAEYWQILQILKTGENKHPSSPERGVGMCLLQKLPSHQGGRWGVVRVLSLSESRYCPTSAWKRFCSRVLMSTALCQSPWPPLSFCLGADGWNAGCPGIRWFPSHFSVPGKAASANEGLMFLICFAVQKSFYWDCNSEDNICLFLQETIWVSELMPRD